MSVLYDLHHCGLYLRVCTLTISSWCFVHVRVHFKPATCSVDMCKPHACARARSFRALCRPAREEVPSAVGAAALHAWPVEGAAAAARGEDAVRADGRLHCAHRRVQPVRRMFCCANTDSGAGTDWVFSVQFWLFTVCVWHEAFGVAARRWVPAGLTNMLDHFPAKLFQFRCARASVVYLYLFASITSNALECAARTCSPAAVVSYSISPMGGNVANMLLPITLRDRGFLVLPGARIRAHCTALTTTLVCTHNTRTYERLHKCVFSSCITRIITVLHTAYSTYSNIVRVHVFVYSTVDILYSILYIKRTRRAAVVAFTIHIMSRFMQRRHRCRRWRRRCRRRARLRRTSPRARWTWCSSSSSTSARRCATTAPRSSRRPRRTATSEARALSSLYARSAHLRSDCECFDITLHL